MSWKADAFVIPAAQRRALTECAAYREAGSTSKIPPAWCRRSSWRRKGEEYILDLGAAPGSKTLQLAELMGNQGRIWAVESVRGRFFRLRDNLARHGAENVQIHLADGTRIWRRHSERFDRVLLDAPCSSEGRFHADAPKTYAYWSQKKIAEASRKQRRLCYSAVQCLKPGGVLVYSTCTFAPEENEAIINRVLRQFAGALTSRRSHCLLPMWHRA